LFLMMSELLTWVPNQGLTAGINETCFQLSPISI
ncbi:unnamed protein product, partial [marine sediment metagenome]